MTQLRKEGEVLENLDILVNELIKDAVDEKLVKPLDPTTAPRYMKYIPIWA